MAKVNSRNKKFEWDNYNLEEIRKEYYSLWMNRFTIKYHVWHVRVLEKLWYIPEDIKKLIVNTC